MLEPAALEVAPGVARALEGLRGCEACLLARMSGSGSTCFGIFAAEAPALAAAERLRAAGLWAAAGPVRPSAPMAEAAAARA
jgi:4-diphosphocytidyl-2-C-methyl-D-erythritol kinase